MFHILPLRVRTMQVMCYITFLHFIVSGAYIVVYNVRKTHKGTYIVFNTGCLKVGVVYYQRGRNAVVILVRISAVANFGVSLCEWTTKATYIQKCVSYIFII